MADNLVIRIGARSDAFQEELESVKKQTKNLEGQLKNIAQISGVAFATLTATAGSAVAAFARFDNELRAVKTLLDDTSFGTKSLEKGFTELKTGVLTIAKETPVAIASLNKSLFDTVSAGIKAGDAIDVVNSSARLATAGITDVSIATDGITSALNAYQLSAKDADLVAAKFFTAQKAGKTTIEELASFFGRTAASASNFGVSLDELLASVAAVTTGGVNTASAFTGLNAVLANIAKPTAEAQKEAERLGISFDSTSLRTKGLQGFLEDLTKAQGFNQQSIEKLFGSVEAQKIAFALTGAQAKVFETTLGSLGNKVQSVTTLNEAFNTQNSSLQNEFVRLKNTVQVAAIQIGEKLAPAVSLAVRFLAGFVDLLTEFKTFATFSAVIIGAAVALTGLVTAGTTAAIVMLKLRSAMIAANISTRALAIGVKGLVGATGIGLLIVIASEVLARWETIWPAIQKTVTVAVSTMAEQLKGLGKILLGVFTWDFTQVKEGFKQVQDSLAKSIDEINKKNKEKKIEPPEIDVNKLEADLKGLNEKTTVALSQDQQDRLSVLKDEIEVQKAIRSGADAEEVNFLKSKLELKRKEEEASKIDNETLRAAELENIKLQRQNILEAEKEFNAKKTEEQISYNEYINNLDLENKETTKLLQDEFAKADEDTRKKRLEGQKKYAEHRAALEEATVNKSIGFANALGEAIIAAEGDNFYAGLALQKAFAIAQIFIDDAKARVSATAAAAAAAPAGGPAAPAVFASVLAGLQATITANTALALGTVAAQTFTQVTRARRAGQAQTGGFVPGLGQGDKMPFFLEPGEFITPSRDADAVISAAANARAAEGRTAFGEPVGSGVEHVVIGLREDISQFLEIVERNVLRNRSMNTGGGV